MHNKFSNFLTRRNLQVGTLGILAMMTSFSLGIQSAGDVNPVSLIEAGSIQLVGDVDGSGVVDSRDAKLILEFAQGYKTPSPMQLRADPNGDGKFSVDDAIRVLATLSNL